MKKIQILMSTYNGEKYLREQIDSILNQNYKEISLLIRDDGSTDGTLAILKSYSEKYSNVNYYSGENIGVQRSFFDLLLHGDQNSDYFAFADQDDYWLPEKVQKAVEQLEEIKNKKQPLLYGGKVIYASEDLKTKEEFAYKNLRKPCFGNALLENIFIGCTEVFNRELLELIIVHQPKCDILHDWWFYLSASCFGEVVYDDNAYILYRQHSDNQVGMQNNWFARWKKRVYGFKKLKNSLSIHAKDFIDSYGVHYKEYKKVLLVAEYKKNLKNKRSIIISKEIYRQQKIDNLIYRFLFLLGLL